MKLATVGKGGSGKTTIAGTLTRIFAERGNKILAIDGDPNPNLAHTLGLTRSEVEKINYIPPSIMKQGERVNDVVQMVPTIPREEIISEYGVKAAPYVDLLVMGQPAHGSAGSGCMCASHRAVRGLVAELTAFGEHTVTDMEAGLEHLKRGTARHVDMMLIVAEPYYRSLEAAMRTAELSRELEIPFIKLVANKVRNSGDEEAIRTFCDQHGIDVIGVVPLDDNLVEAERLEKAPYDFKPDSPGVQSIRKIAQEIVSLGVN
jgi:CO dehydrogenase maturation factor